MMALEIMNLEKVGYNNFEGVFNHITTKGIIKKGYRAEARLELYNLKTKTEGVYRNKCLSETIINEAKELLNLLVELAEKNNICPHCFSELNLHVSGYDYECATGYMYCGCGEYAEAV